MKADDSDWLTEHGVASECQLELDRSAFGFIVAFRSLWLHRDSATSVKFTSSNWQTSTVPVSDDTWTTERPSSSDRWEWDRFSDAEGWRETKLPVAIVCVNPVKTEKTLLVWRQHRYTWRALTLPSQRRCLFKQYNKCVWFLLTACDVCILWPFHVL